MSKRRPSVVTVYHRAPFGEDAHGAMTPRREHSSPNGIIPTLRDAFHERASGVWVAWTSANAALRPGFAHDVTVEYDGSHIDVHRVALSASAVDSFYHRFSKEALWPIICSFPASARFDEHLWTNFVDVNTRFADAVSRIAAPDSRILVHDYNLWLVPGLLRSRMPGARIGFFHHTPFPAADIFAILPWRDEILASLLACDLVGFHLPHYANNFATAAANLAAASIARQELVPASMSAPGTPLSAPRIVRELGLGDRRIRLGAFPAAIDSARIDAIRATPAHARRVAAIRQELGGRRALLSLERLDYVKGPVEKLLAFERFLESRTGSDEEITLVSVLAPAAQAVSVHVATRAQVDECVERINERFGTAAWTPVHQISGSLSFEEVVSWYEAADVAWITPLRDGLNLVAKEFVAASDGASKALVLSEFAGAHVELRDAVTVNPYSPRSMDSGLRAALDMSGAERRRRMLRMNAIVRSETPRSWGATLLGEL